MTRSDGGRTPARHRVRRSGAIAGVLAIGMAAAASACSTGHQSSAGCSRLGLTVAAAPQIAPAVESVAANYNATHPKPGGNCVQVNVEQSAPAQVASSLAGQGMIITPARPDVWIPDSTLWVDQARSTSAGAARVAAAGQSVAISPIVLAVPHAVAGQLAASGNAPNWKMLIPTSLPSNDATGGSAVTAAGANSASPALGLKILDPVTNAAGMASLLAMRSVVGHGQTGLISFVTVARASQFLTEPDNSSLFGALFSSSQPTGGLTDEQAVWAHNKADPRLPVTAVYLSPGSPVLDFPYVATTSNSAKRLALADFASALRAPYGQQAIRGQGLRTPDGAAGPGFESASGVSQRAPAILPLPSAATADAVREMWARILVGVRMLVVLDVSPSMGQLVPGTPVSRLQAITELSGQGLSLLDKNDVIGLWTFDTGLADPFNYRVVAPMRPLNQVVSTDATDPITQRELLLGALAAQQPQVDTVTALYQTIRSAFRTVSNGYTPDRFNGVVVMTDGKDYDPRPNPLTLSSLLSTLRSEFNPQRPVNVLIVGYGHSVDFAAMSQIAQATQGGVYEADSPAGIEKFYLQMLTRLVCNGNCPAP